MTLPIGSITPSYGPASAGAIAPVKPAGVAPASAGGFGEFLSRLVSSVDSSASSANVAVERMLDGTGEVHDAMIALQRAELTLQLTVQMRNNLVQAYQDIMRMPV